MDEAIRRIASALQDEGIRRPTALRLARATIAALEEGDSIGRGLVIARRPGENAAVAASRRGKEADEVGRAC